MRATTRRDALKLAGLSLPLGAAASAVAQTPQRKKYLILSCDGGGIRGLLTAKIIQRLQKEVPFLDQVQLFAGTSTGGIIALGLAHSVSPSDLVGLYRDRGPEIFNKGETKPPVAGKLQQWLAEINEKRQSFLNSLQFNPQELIHPMYANEGLSRALTDIFGATTLGNVKSGKSVLVTTLRLYSEAKNWAPLVLHNVGLNQKAANTRVQDGPTPMTKLVDAALCTSAAPLYFPPHQHPKFGYCIDGGLFANCPASIALGLALRANQGDLESIRILSIGTGAQISGIDLTRSTPFNKPADYGALAWLDPIDRGEAIGNKQKLTPAFPLISALFDASSSSHNYVCNQALGSKYHRVQVDLPKPIALDDTTKDTLAFLESGDTLIPTADWQATVKWVKDQIS